MCRTQHREPHSDSLTTTLQTDFFYTTGYNPTSPRIVIGFETETQPSTQPTPERGYDQSNIQLGMLLLNLDPSLDMPQPKSYVVLTWPQNL